MYKSSGPFPPTAILRRAGSAGEVLAPKHILKRYALGLLALLLHFSPICSGAEHGATLVIRGVTLIDVSGASPKRDVTVVVTNNRIHSIGRKVRVPGADATIINGKGKYLIPGLWDMHVHWYEEEFLPLFLANGVTGIRMMWGYDLHHDWRKRIEDGSLLGPRMSIASTVIDGPRPIWPGSRTAGNAEEGRQAVNRALLEKPDFLKVYSALPRDAYFAITDEAKKLGIPVVGHIPMTVSALEAARSGLKCNEHLEGILEACSSREEDLLRHAQDAVAGYLATNDTTNLPRCSRELSALALQSFSEKKARKLFGQFRRHGFWQCPTLTVQRSLGSLQDPALKQDPRLKYMSDLVRTMWDPANNPHAKGLTEEDYEKRKKVLAAELKVVGLMQKSGVGLLAGTDAMNAYCFPGFSLHEELELFVKAGLTPLQALQTATINPALFLGRKDFGTVQPGKLADFLLLDGNPLENISNTRRIHAVVYDGKLFDRETLDAMLFESENLANRKSLSKALLAIIEKRGADFALEQYLEWKITSPDEYSFGELAFMLVCSELLEAKKIKETLRIGELYAHEFPNSYTHYLLMAEAHALNGDKQLAIKNYQKVLTLSPGNAEAEAALKRLEEKK